MKNDKKYILILGAGGHGIVVADIIEQMHQTDIEIRGFLDDNAKLHGESFIGYKVLGGNKLIKNYPDDEVIIAVGNNGIRKEIVKKWEKVDIKYFTTIHPKCVISKYAKVGQGSMICAGVVVNPEANIGNHVILNTGCSVDHHNVIGDFVHIAPGAHLGGEVVVGSCALVGLGSSVLPRVQIGEGAVIGAGSVVVTDIPANCVAYGNPAKIIRKIK